MPFDVNRTATESGVVVFALSGTMTMGNLLQKFEWSIEEELKNQQCRIVVDMSQVSYLDSSAIGVLVACSGKVKAAGGQFRLAAVMPRVATILGITGADGILASDATRDAAVSALAAKA